MEMVTFEPWFMHTVQAMNQKMPDIKLRDLFAISAMNAIIADHTVQNLDDILSDDHKGYYLRKVPEAAYKMADAMLEARSKK